MNRAINPIESLTRIVIIGVFTICTILYFIKAAASSKTPIDRHIEYILEKHNNSCQYEMGECPQFECSHYGQPIPSNNILKQTTDDRGLISVVYHQNGEDWALDYITRDQYDSLVSAINK